jgi:hypothetical protein
MHDRHMPEVKVTAFRFTEEELELLGVIEGHTGIRSRTEALRKVLQAHAHDESGEPGEKAASEQEAKTEKR